jgi:hypothetical protein
MYCPALLLFKAYSALCYIIFIHRCNVFQYFLLSNMGDPVLTNKLGGVAHIYPSYAGGIIKGMEV